MKWPETFEDPKQQLLHEKARLPQAAIDSLLDVGLLMTSQNDRIIRTTQCYLHPRASILIAMNSDKIILLWGGLE